MHEPEKDNVSTAGYPQLGTCKASSIEYESATTPISGVLCCPRYKYWCGNNSESH